MCPSSHPSVQAVELIKDPSGEVELVVGSNVTFSKNSLGNGISPADNATIMELRRTVDSLKQEIEKVVAVARTVFCIIWFPFMSAI